MDVFSVDRLWTDTVPCYGYGRFLYLVFLFAPKLISRTKNTYKEVLVGPSLTRHFIVLSILINLWSVVLMNSSRRSLSCTQWPVVQKRSSLLIIMHPPRGSDSSIDERRHTFTNQYHDLEPIFSVIMVPPVLITKLPFNYFERQHKSTPN
ncbi:hypothetical protein C8R48DRAFT_698265 [Suillus tomentosus]|nr:hypothetical protein C8R48DRAFT_698265 [Suillus tomentosus]